MLRSMDIGFTEMSALEWISLILLDDDRKHQADAYLSLIQQKMDEQKDAILLVMDVECVLDAGSYYSFIIK